jgi:hypothetical protein
VQRLLARGAAASGTKQETDAPLWHACRSGAPDDRRLVIADLLLGAGANPRRACRDKTTAIQMASRHSPLAMVERLIRGGALSWQTDEHGKEALDYAKEGVAPDKAAIIELLDRGARTDTADTLWHSTPLGWAIRMKKAKAEACLRERLRAPAASA